MKKYISVWDNNGPWKNGPWFDITADVRCYGSDVLPGINKIDYVDSNDHQRIAYLVDPDIFGRFCWIPQVCIEQKYFKESGSQSSMHITKSLLLKLKEETTNEFLKAQNPVFATSVLEYLELNV